jgi:hypothetical protein
MEINKSIKKKCAQNPAGDFRDIANAMKKNKGIDRESDNSANGDSQYHAQCKIDELKPGTAVPMNSKLAVAMRTIQPASKDDTSAIWTSLRHSSAPQFTNSSAGSFSMANKKPIYTVLQLLSISILSDCRW